jgi:hypothetical protein
MENENHGRERRRGDQAHLLGRRIQTLAKRVDYLVRKIAESRPDQADFYKSERSATETGIWAMRFFKAVMSSEGNPIDSVDRAADLMGRLHRDGTRLMGGLVSVDESDLDELARLVAQAQNALHAMRDAPQMPVDERGGGRWSDRERSQGDFGGGSSSDQYQRRR